MAVVSVDSISLNGFNLPATLQCCAFQFFGHDSKYCFGGVSKWNFILHFPF